MAKKKPRPAPSAPPRAAAAPSRVWPRVFAAAMLGLIALYFLRLADQAYLHKIYTDECYHAYVSAWIARYRTLPRSLPIFYSGFYYYYPPLFHLLGAVWAGLLGNPALKYLNLFLNALLLVALYLGVKRSLRSSVGVWVVLLCVSNAWLALYAVRLYTEALITLLAAAAFLLLLRLARREAWRDALLLGVVTGLTLVAKQSSPLLLGLLLVLAIVYAARGRARLAGQLATALGLGAVIAAPYFIRNQVLFGSAFYPVGGADIDRELYRMTMARFSSPAWLFYRQALNAIGPWILAAFLFALIRRLWSRRWDLLTGLLAYCVIVVVTAPLLPIHDPRHIIPIIPVMALLACLVIAEATARRPGPRAAIGGALLTAVIASLVMPPLPAYSLADELDEAYAAIRQHTPENANILSLETYDTAYYTMRNATWPIPWGQPPSRRAVDLFYETDPARFLEEMRRDSIDCILIPKSSRGGAFNAANYPDSFDRCLAALTADQRLIVLWRSAYYVLVGRPGR